MDSDLENSAGKQRGGFRPGHSGNPAGKPPGTRHRVTVLAEKLMADDAESVVRAVIGAAQSGDMTAARLILDRIAPVRKGRPVPLPLPTVETAADVMAALGVTVTAMSEGEITPDEAAVVAGVLEIKRRAIETVEIERRIAALEERTQ